MSNFSVKTARLIGRATQTSWTQTHVFDSAFLILVLGRLKDQDEVNLAASGKKLILHIEELYKEAAKKNLETLRGVVENAIATVQDCEVLTLVVGVISGNVLYIACQNGQVLIKRRGVVAQVVKGGQTPLLASGYLDEGDIVFFTSSALGTYIVEKKEELIPLDNIEELKEIISLAMQAGQEKGALVSLIVKVIPQASKAVVDGPYLDSPVQPTPVRQTRITRVLPSIFPLQSLIGGKNRRVITTAFLLIACLLIISLVFGIRQRGEQAHMRRFQQAFTIASQKYDEGRALSDLNPSLAAKTLREGMELVEKEFVDTAQNTTERKRLAELKKNIEQALGIALRIETLDDAPVFFDLTLIKEGARGKTMSLVKGVLIILDTTNHALYTLTVPNKKAELVSGNLAEPTFEALGSSYAFVLTKNGIERVALRTKKSERIVENDTQWGEIGGLVSFAGNLYVLDRGKGAIYKYSIIETDQSHNSKRNYLDPDIHPDFTRSVAMVIDGSVWVLFSDGRISKFLQGLPQAFAISGIDMPLSQPRAFFTDDENEYLYIQDWGNKRIIMVKKDGTYVSQYRWEGVKDVTDMVVSEKEKKILLLSGSKIYAIAISDRD